MDRDRLLSGLLVRGELSNYKMYPSGHHYFYPEGQPRGPLRCVMFRGDAASLRFRPENGMQVIAAGRVTVVPTGRAVSALLRPPDPGGSGGPARGL